VLQRINDDHFSWKEWAYAGNAGILLIELTHFVDLAYYFIEREPALVGAAGSSMMNVVVNITFEDGSLATIFDACVGTFGYPKELCEIYHQGAAIIVDHCMEVRTAGIPGQPYRRLYPAASDPTAAGIESWYDRAVEAMRRPVDAGSPLAAPGPNKGHYEILDAFIQACRGKGENPCDAASGARAAVIVLRAAESLRQGGVPQRIAAEEYLAP
jgi:predicted dehydrogenase